MRFWPRYRITAATSDFGGLPRKQPRDRPAMRRAVAEFIATAASSRRKVRPSRSEVSGLRRLQPVGALTKPLPPPSAPNSGLSRQTPSMRMTKSAGSKTWPLTKSNTARSTFGGSSSIKIEYELDLSLPGSSMSVVLARLRESRRVARIVRRRKHGGLAASPRGQPPRPPGRATSKPLF